MITLSLNINI